MTREQFDATSFRRGMYMLYRGRRYEIAAVDFERGEMEFVNENGNHVWRTCEQFETE
jgi:hypothetical protein